MTESEKLSYLIPRDPSIKCWNDRVKLHGPLTHNMVKLGLDDMEDSQSEKLKVYLRIKPCQVEPNPYVVTNNTLETEAPNDKKNSKNEKKFIHRFNFTSIFNQDSSQESVFHKCVVENLKKFINGRNDVLFAYGTTNSGKTYTMQGTVEKPGLIPRSIQFVFNCLKDNLDADNGYQPFRYDELYPLSGEESLKEALHKNFILSLDLSKYRYTDLSNKNLRADSTKSSSVFSDNYENVTFREMENNLEDLEYEVDNGQYSLWISMIEIYNEQIYDLLRIPFENESRVKLGFAEDENGKVYIRDLCYVNVKSGHEAFQVFQFGRANLRFGPTALNNHSSRSHCIFTLTLAKFVECGNFKNAVLSRFSFCDLAGLERVKKALTDGHRLAESKCINVSLSIFVKCLRIIKENQTSAAKKLVPYRESKLTRLFRDEMIGKGSFGIIVNITPELHLSNETLNVLKFSTIAQRIIPVNVFPKSKKLQQKRKSKFATLVAKTNDTSVIDWESAEVVDLKKEDQCNHAYESLLSLVDSLKDELRLERERANNIEKKIREEVVMKVSKLVEEHDEASRNMLESETQRIQEMYEKKEKRLMHYLALAEEKAKKRRRIEDSSDYIDFEKQIETLKMEIDCLKSENTSLRELIQQMNGDHNSLQVRYTQLEIELSEKDRLLKLSEKNREECDAEGDKYVKDLEAQVTEYKAKISELKNLLHESAFEYRDILETNKLLREENNCLTQDVAAKSSVLEDLKNELQENQAIISAKSVKIEELETELEKVLENLGSRVIDMKKSLESKNPAEPAEKCENMEHVRSLEKCKNDKDFVNSLTKSPSVQDNLSGDGENENKVEDDLLIKSGVANDENIGGVVESGSDSLKSSNKSLSPKIQVLSGKTSVNVDSKMEELCTPERLNRQIEKLSIINTESKKSCKKTLKAVDESIHPSLIKSCSKSKRRGKKGKDINDCNKGKDDKDEKIVKDMEDREERKEPVTRKGKKCTKKLFTENDFDGIVDLESSFTEGKDGIQDAAEKEIYDLYLGKFWGLTSAVNAACTILRVDQIIMAKRSGGPKEKHVGSDDEC